MDEESGFGSFVAKVEAMAEQQHRLATSIIAQFVEFTHAVEPLLLACKDAAVLAKAMEDIERVNTAVMELAREGGMVLDS